ncbi:hypothetical protein D3C85_1924610 [compost metagenome]
MLLFLTPLLEGLQHYLQPSRQFSAEDILANLLGVLLALVGWLALDFTRRQVTARL